MDVFRLRDSIIREDYALYTGSFIEIADERIRSEVEARPSAGALWPEPLIQFNPAYASGGNLADLSARGSVNPRLPEFFRIRRQTLESLQASGRSG